MLMDSYNSQQPRQSMVDMLAPVNRLAPLNRGLMAWLAPSSQQRARIPNLMGGYASAAGNLIGFSAKSPPCNINGSWYTTATGDYFTTSLNYAANSDFTFSLWINPTAWAGNPGFWRDGLTWNIFSGTSGRPWVYWNGTQILAPGSGYAISLGEWWHLIWEVKSGSYVNWYVNGDLKHTATHAIATGAFAITNIGYQLIESEGVFGHYADLRFHNVAFGEGFARQTYQAAISGFQNELNWLPRNLIVPPITAATFNPAWARNSNSIIGLGATSRA